MATFKEPLALIQTLQGQVATLTAAAATAPLACFATPAPAAFADTPNVLGVNVLIDYLTEIGWVIYEWGSQALDDKALTDGFLMTQAQTIVFVEALQLKCSQMGWNQSTKQITSFINREGRSVDIIKNYARWMKQCSSNNVSNSASQEKQMRCRSPSKTKQWCVSASPSHSPLKPKPNISHTAPTSPLMASNTPLSCIRWSYILPPWTPLPPPRP